MTTPTKVIVDCSTGEETILPLTVEEITQMEAAVLAAAAQQEEAAQAAAALAALKASAKAKLIAGQPLTAEEADTLVI